MKKSKLIISVLASSAAVIAPVITLISCGGESEKTTSKNQPKSDVKYQVDGQIYNTLVEAQAAVALLQKAPVKVWKYSGDASIEFPTEKAALDYAFSKQHVSSAAYSIADINAHTSQLLAGGDVVDASTLTEAQTSTIYYITNKDSSKHAYKTRASAVQAWLTEYPTSAVDKAEMPSSTDIDKILDSFKDSDFRPASTATTTHVDKTFRAVDSDVNAIIAMLKDEYFQASAPMMPAFNAQDGAELRTLWNAVDKTSSIDMKAFITEHNKPPLKAPGKVYFNNVINLANFGPGTLEKDIENAVEHEILLLEGRPALQEGVLHRAYPNKQALVDAIHMTDSINDLEVILNKVSAIVPSISYNVWTPNISAGSFIRAGRFNAVADSKAEFATLLRNYHSMLEVETKLKDMASLGYMLAPNVWTPKHSVEADIPQDGIKTLLVDSANLPSITDGMTYDPTSPMAHLFTSVGNKTLYFLSGDKQHAFLTESEVRSYWEVNPHNAGIVSAVDSAKKFQFVTSQGLTKVFDSWIEANQSNNGLIIEVQVPQAPAPSLAVDSIYKA